MSIEWFPGSIEEAIENANPNDKLLITFIDGSDKSSAKLLRYLNEPTTFAKIKQNHIKLFKISSSSEKFKQFTTTYKTVPVPSIFFLDQTGKPIGVITSDIVSAEALERKFDRILDLIPPNESLHTIKKYSSFEFNKRTSKKGEYSSEDEDENVISSHTAKSRLISENPSKLTERERIRQQIAVDRYELSQRQANLYGGQDLQVNRISVAPTTSVPTKNQETKNHKNISEEPTKSEIPNTSLPQHKNDLPMLTKLLIRFDNGKAHNQHFTYKTSLGVVRGYIQEVVKHGYNGNFSFYVSATSPFRLLDPELDKVSLEDLGLYPVAELLVKINKQRITTDKIQEFKHRNLIEKLGGVNTILFVFLWIAFSPVMIGTNWCGICSKQILEVPIEDVGSWMYRNIPDATSELT